MVVALISHIPSPSLYSKLSGSSFISGKSPVISGTASPRSVMEYLAVFVTVDDSLSALVILSTASLSEMLYQPFSPFAGCPLTVIVGASGLGEAILFTS